VDACGRSFSDTIVPLLVPVLAVQVGDYHPDVLFKTTNAGTPKKQWLSRQVFQRRVSGGPYL